MIKIYQWAYNIRGNEGIVISPWQGCQNTSDVENSPLAIHKICMQISLGWKVTLLLGEEEKKGSEGYFEMTVLNIKKP